MSIDDMRALLGLGPNVADATVVAAYAAYIAEQGQTASVATLPDAPTPTDLRMRWPSLASVDDVTIQYWLTDAMRFVDDSWPIVGDRSPALIAAAAHNMMTAGVAGIGDADITALLAAGVTDFQSGGREGFRVSLSPLAIAQALDGGYDATRPGQEYLRLLARNKGGGGTTSPGAVIGCNIGFNGFAGQLGYPAALYEGYGG